MLQVIVSLALIAASASIAVAQATTFGPGTHLIGSDIESGLYRTEGEIRYFARLSGLSGDFGDIIMNEVSPSVFAHRKHNASPKRLCR